MCRAWEAAGCPEQGWEQSPLLLLLRGIATRGAAPVCFSIVRAANGAEAANASESKSLQPEGYVNTLAADE